MRKFVFFLLLSLSISQSSNAKEKIGKDEKAAIAASPQQISEIVAVRSDPLDTVISLSTEPFYKQKGIFRTVSGDKFLRAMIDKKTGETIFQIYLWFNYSGEWILFDRMNYIGPNGLVSIEGRKIDSDIGRCSAYSCSKIEHVVFIVPREHLEFISKGAQGGDDGRWQFKLFGRYENGQTITMLKTEIAGMLIAVDRERDKLQIPK